MTTFRECFLKSFCLKKAYFLTSKKQYMNLKKVLKLMVPCAMLSFAHLVSNATTVIVTPGSTLPSVINSGDIYICQGTSTFYGNSVSIMPTAKLVIKDGATLKMTGRIVVNNGSASWPVGGGSPSIVEGGVLEINNATITSQNAAANGRWLGIEVWGKGGMFSLGTSPYYEARGKVIINGGTITKATCGIINTSRIVSTSPFYSYPKKGGIVQADNALFLNNDTMIYHVGKPFMFAPKKKLSIHINGPEHFVNCTFKLDANYTHSTPSGAVLHPWMVRLVDANGLQFLACKFINNKYYGPTFANRNVLGIYALNSSFKVSNKYKVTGFTPWGGSLSGTTTGESKFDNFYDAIYAENGFGTKPVVIENSNFNDVTLGIRGMNLKLPIIVNNKITLTQIGSDPNSTNTPLGDRTIGIELLGSTLFKVTDNEINGIDGYKLSYGIAVKSAGTIINRVNLNTLKNTKYALRGEWDGDNPTDLNQGLKFLCNNLETNNNSTSSYDISSMENGVSSLQGFKDHTLAGAEYHLCPRNTFKLSKTTGAWHLHKLESGDNTYVKTGLGSLSPFNPKPSLSNNYTIITGELIPMVYIPEDTQTVYFTCSGNPNITMLSSGISSRIEQASNTIQLLGNIANKSLDEQQAYDNAVLQYYEAMDSVIAYYYYNIVDSINASDLISVLQKAKGHFYHQLLLSDIYISLNDFEEANSVLQGIKSDFSLNVTESNMIDQMISLIPIINKYYNNYDGDWQSLSQVEQETITNLKDNGIGYAQGMARSLWFMHHPFSLEDNPYIWGVIDDNTAQKPALQNGINQKNTVSIYPNPNNGSFNIDLNQVYDEKNQYTYSIIDIGGAEMASGILANEKNIITLGSIKNGLYVIQIKSNDELIAIQKLSIMGN